MAKAQVRTSFTGVDAFSVVAAQADAAKMVKGITEETRQAIRDVIAKSIADGVAPRDTAKLVREIVGLNSRQALAVQALRDRLHGRPQGFIDGAVAAYSNKLLRVRAEMIARTEIMRAQNAGQRAAWDDAVAKGEIGANSQKMWIVAPDDRLCPNCEPLSGETVPLTAKFSAGVEEPPLHPRCRCTVGLVPAKVPESLTVVAKPELSEAEIAKRLEARTLANVRRRARAATNKAAREAATERTLRDVEVGIEHHVAVNPPGSGWLSVSKETIQAQFANDLRVVMANKNVSALLGEANVNIALTNGTVTDVPLMHRFRGVQPRGWSPGSSWDTVRGVFHGTPSGGSGTIIAGGRGDGGSVGSVLAHEFGHGVDYAMRAKTELNWLDKTLGQTWREEVLPRPGVSPYFKQSTRSIYSNASGQYATVDAGLEETFAESWSAYVHHGLPKVQEMFGKAWADEFAKAVTKVDETGRKLRVVNP